MCFDEKSKTITVIGKQINLVRLVSEMIKISPVELVFIGLALAEEHGWLLDSIEFSLQEYLKIIMKPVKQDYISDQLVEGNFDQILQVL